MNVKYINPFLEAAYNVIKTMAKIELKPVRPFLRNSKKVYGSVRAKVEFKGNTEQGTLVVGFDTTLILGILYRMFGEKLTTIDQNAYDAVGELTNMIGGQANAILEKSGLNIKQEPPQVIQEPGYIEHKVPPEKVMVIPLSCPVGKLYVEVSLEKNIEESSKLSQQSKDFFNLFGKQNSQEIMKTDQFVESFYKADWEQIKEFCSDEQVNAFTEERKSQIGETGVTLIDTLVTAFNFIDEQKSVEVQIVEQNNETAAVKMKHFKAKFNAEGFLAEGSFED